MGVAKRVAPQMTREGKNPAAVALGRHGGLKGGPARGREGRQGQAAVLRARYLDVRRQ